MILHYVLTILYCGLLNVFHYFNSILWNISAVILKLGLWNIPHSELILRTLIVLCQMILKVKVKTLSDITKATNWPLLSYTMEKYSCLLPEISYNNNFSFYCIYTYWIHCTFIYLYRSKNQTNKTKKKESEIVNNFHI